ncbi:MAG: hypothetical protein ACTS3F_08075 [Phycisphaerales bacterium]
MLIAGIDEAGYGPLLGPLCVAMTVFKIDPPREARAASTHAADTLPDLWHALRPSVVREPRDAGTTAVAIADSKRLKLPNNHKTMHPLRHLERGVLTLAGDALSRARCDLSACAACGATPPIDRLWWSGPPVPLPLGSTPEELALLRTHVEATRRRVGVEVIEARCLAMDAPEFNAALRDAARAPDAATSEPGEHPDPSKARVLWALVAQHLRRVWHSREAAAAGMDETSDPPRVIVDRQGGRTDYLSLLAEALDAADVRCLGRTRDASAYEAVSSGTNPRRLRVMFRTEAESKAMPVALASMLAKLVRELWMNRFNAYWCAQMPELKPTAGYTLDARRWLTDAAPMLDTECRAMLCRAR